MPEQERLINVGVQSLTDSQVLTLYHAINTSDNTSSVSQQFIDAVTERADKLLSDNTQLSDKNETACDYYYNQLDSKKQTQEYKDTITNAGHYVDSIIHNTDYQRVSHWSQQDYEDAVADFSRAAKVLAEQTSTEVITIDEAADENRFKEALEKLNEVQSKIAEQAKESNTIDAATKEALEMMSSTLTDLEIRSTIGDSDYRGHGYTDTDNISISDGAGTGGQSDSGSGQSYAGNGTGDGIAGNGNGTGTGDGDGAIDTAKDGSTASTVAVSNTNTTSETKSIASYLNSINGDAAINHIFKNDFYNTEPVAHWAFSVDFIPAITLTNDNINLLSMGQTLTKAIIKTQIPDRQIGSTVSNYKGMTIELPARAKTAGSISMTFAENNTFVVSTILDNLFQYARSNNYFENINSEIQTAKFNSEEELQQYMQILRAYRRALPKGGHIYNILVKLYKMKDTKALDDENSTSNPTFVYYFKGCDLKTVKSIDFNYDNDKPVDVSCEWIYQYFEELTYDEYLQRYGSMATPAQKQQLRSNYTATRVQQNTYLSANYGHTR